MWRLHLKARIKWKRAVLAAEQIAANPSVAWLCEELCGSAAHKGSGKSCLMQTRKMHCSSWFPPAKLDTPRDAPAGCTRAGVALLWAQGILHSNPAVPVWFWQHFCLPRVMVPVVLVLQPGAAGEDGNWG